MLRKSIVMMVLVLGVVALAAVAWAGAAGPYWPAGPMMGSDEPGPGAGDEGDWADMAQWMQQMDGTGPGADGEGDWADMDEWMEQVHPESPSLCPHRGYASTGEDGTTGG